MSEVVNEPSVDMTILLAKIRDHIRDGVSILEHSLHDELVIRVYVLHVDLLLFLRFNWLSLPNQQGLIRQSANEANLVDNNPSVTGVLII